MTTFWRVERSLHSINSFHGEAGHGIYATPNQNVLNYYKQNTEPFYRIVRFELKKGFIVDCRKHAKNIISKIKESLAQFAQRSPGYAIPKVNLTNYWRYPWALSEWVSKGYSGAAGYLVPHKLPDQRFNGLQLVILDLDKFECEDVATKCE